MRHEARNILKTFTKEKGFNIFILNDFSVKMKNVKIPKKFMT